MMPDYRKAARRAARRHGIDPDVFERQINAESGFNPSAGSPAGARGIAQFMPATARSMGVNLSDGRASDDLDGAARLMASYVRKYGSYENALRAYNAGPAAIKASRGYGETNSYVARILNGQEPKASSPGSSSSGPPERVTETVPGVDNSAQRQALKLAYLSQRGKPGGLLELAAGLRQAQDVPATTMTRTVRRSESRPTSEPMGGARGASGEIKELFYNGPGGVNADNGKRVQSGFVSGHTDHVHVAAGPKRILEIAKLAKQMGLTVRELEPYDKVDPVHTGGSYHYRKQAADISGDPKKMAAFSRAVARRFNLK